jgi:ATPase related to the helicase subunit of the Holliday junction resolvase
LKDAQYYFPTNQGTESKVQARMDYLAELRKKRNK